MSHVTLIVLVALALVLRLLLIVFFVVIASLVKERRIGIVENVLGEGSDLAESLQELLGRLVF